MPVSGYLAPPELLSGSLTAAQAWPACAPVILAGLRGAGDSIIQLLPNLM
jgi:hypothetical protein